MIGPNLTHIGIAPHDRAPACSRTTPQHLALWIKNAPHDEAGHPACRRSARASSTRSRKTTVARRRTDRPADRRHRRVPAGAQVTGRTGDSTRMATTADRAGLRAAAEPRSATTRHLELADDGRSQADRDAVPATRRSSSSSSAALEARHHARAADGPERHARVGRDVQPAVHDARHDDGLPRRHAAVGRVLQLPDPAADRRARRRVPAPQRVQLLGVPVRRHVHHVPDLLRRRAGRRLVRLRAAHHASSTRRASTSTSGCSASRSSASRRWPRRSTSSRRSSTCARRA